MSAVNLNPLNRLSTSSSSPLLSSSSSSDMPEVNYELPKKLHQSISSLPSLPSHKLKSSSSSSSSSPPMTKLPSSKSPVSPSPSFLSSPLSKSSSSSSSSSSSIQSRLINISSSSSSSSSSSLNNDGIFHNVLQEVKNDLHKTLQYRCNILRNIPSFSHVNDTDINMLAQSLQEIQYKYNDYIIHQDEKGDAMYILEQGVVQIVRSSIIDGDVVLSKLLQLTKGI